MIKRKEEVDKYFSLEGCLKAIEGSRAYSSINLAKLYLVSNVTVLKKFKVPEFEKYNGLISLKTHIITYYKEMIEMAYNDKLLSHFFQRSLIGAALKWYMQLDSSWIKI